MACGVVHPWGRMPSLPSQLVAYAPPGTITMKKLVVGIVSTVVSTIGWAIGAKVGIMTAFMLSMVGLGVGIYAGARLAKQWQL